MAEGIEELAPQSLFAKRRLRLVYLLLVAVATVLLAYRLREALNPLLISVIAAYVLNPLVRFLQVRAHIPRTLGILLIYAVGVLVFVGASAYSIRQSAVGLDKLMTKITGGWQVSPSPVDRRNDPTHGLSPWMSDTVNDATPSAPRAVTPSAARSPSSASGTATIDGHVTGTAIMAGSVEGSAGDRPEAETGSALVSIGAAAIAALEGRELAKEPSIGPDHRPRRLVGVPVYGDGEILRMGQSPLLGYIDTNQNGLIDPSEPEFTKESGRWRPTPRFSTIVHRVPGYLDDIRERLESRLPAHTDRSDIEQIANLVQNASASLASAGASIWGWINENLFGGIARIVLYALLVPLYTFFLLRGFDDMVRLVRGFLPGLQRDRIEAICTRIDRSLAAFFRGRLLICLGKGTLMAIGLALCGVDFAVTIGVVAAVLSLVPAIGPLVTMALAAICSYGPDDGWSTRIIGSAFVIGGIETLEISVSPIILGRESGLHPMAVLISFFLFGDLFGLFGVLLAVPLAATVKILTSEFVLPELQHLAAEQPGTEVSGFFVAPRHLEGEPPRPPAGAK